MLLSVKNICLTMFAIQEQIVQFLGNTPLGLISKLFAQYVLSQECILCLKYNIHSKNNTNFGVAIFRLYSLLFQLQLSVFMTNVIEHTDVLRLYPPSQCIFNKNTEL